MHMPSIPVDILHHILEHVDKASLAKICLANKVCCSCSQGILYRDIQIDGQHVGSTKLCQTLSESTHLAKRVRSFEMIDFGYEDRDVIDEVLRKSLQNMTRLRSLSFLDKDPNFGILDGCTFKLDSFHSAEDYSQDELRRFLCSQPSLTNVKIGCFNFSYVPELGVECLPNLTQVTTCFTWLPHIIPNRPVNQVISYGYKWRNEYVDLSFFTLSTAPIQKLAIDYSHLYSAPLGLLASIFPSLTHLTLRRAPTRRKVSEPVLFIYQ
jgi:hypothetical protein